MACSEHGLSPIAKLLEVYSAELLERLFRMRESGRGLAGVRVRLESRMRGLSVEPGRAEGICRSSYTNLPHRHTSESWSAGTCVVGWVAGVANLKREEKRVEFLGDNSGVTDAL